jgi:hypothetical protein
MAIWLQMEGKCWCRCVSLRDPAVTQHYYVGDSCHGITEGTESRPNQSSDAASTRGDFREAMLPMKKLVVIVVDCLKGKRDKKSISVSWLLKTC